MTATIGTRNHRSLIARARKPKTSSKVKASKAETTKNKTTQKKNTKNKTKSTKDKNDKNKGKDTKSTTAPSCKRVQLFKSKGKNTAQPKHTGKKISIKRADNAQTASIYHDLNFVGMRQTKTRGPTGRLWTDSLDTCIGLVAISPSGYKVMTHAVATSISEDYRKFKTEVDRLGSGMIVYASFPPDNQTGSRNQPLIDTKNYIRSKLNRDFPRTSDKIQTRQERSTNSAQVGQMSIEADGKIWISECAAEPARGV